MKMETKFTTAAKKIMTGDISEVTLRELALALREENEMLIGAGFGSMNEIKATSLLPR